MAIAFRDSVNKLTGKQQLIDKYNNAVSELSQRSDSLYESSKKKALLARLEEITEDRWVEGENGIIETSSFNPYRLTSTKAKIKSKLADLNKLMQEHNIR
jgi:hypothetical protein